MLHSDSRLSINPLLPLKTAHHSRSAPSPGHSVTLCGTPWQAIPASSGAPSLFCVYGGRTPAALHPRPRQRPRNGVLTMEYKEMKTFQLGPVL
ncbi:hypothetical protein SRHO_G00003610 [Serrasalmus rhombeus]